MAGNGIETITIVGDAQNKVFFHDLQLNSHPACAGVPGNVADGLLEDQVNLAAHFGIGTQMTVFDGGMKLESDIPAAQHVGREAAHSEYQVAKVIVFRLDRPDDIAHG